MKTIELELSPEGIDRALKELTDYTATLAAKTEQFVDRLRQIGLKVIEDNGNPPGDSQPGTADAIITSSGGTTKCTLFLEGKDVLFIEFGAGIHFNGAAGSSPHPMGAEFGYTIGSYGFGQGAKDSWTYKDGTERVVSYGTLAGMPMYKASQEMRRQLVAIARDVFERGG